MSDPFLNLKDNQIEIIVLSYLIKHPTFLDEYFDKLNDKIFYNPEHKKYVDEILTKNRFTVDYHEPLTTHEGLFPHCRDQFYQVWKRTKKVKGPINIFSPFN